MRQKEVKKGDSVSYNGFDVVIVSLSLNSLIIEYNGKQKRVSYSSIKAIK